jgi:aminomethyltransferase
MKATFDVHVGHPEVYPVQVQGPKSKDVMRDLFDDRIPDIPYYRCEQTDLDSIPIVISRLGRYGSHEP